MRFRAKFGALGWAYVATASFAGLLSLSPGPHEKRLLLAAVFCVLALQRILNHSFTYWDVDAKGVRERRFWREKSVAWQEVDRVSAWNRRQPWSDFLAIHYARSSPSHDSGSIVANPKDREGFLADLRKHAPQALFEV
jgi:hypothetical protein